jgi:hypothetical protein
MKRFLTGIASLIANAVAAQQRTMRPEVPIVIEASDDTDACNASGIVKGLDPHGDGFLAVKSAPSLQALRIDKLYNGERVYLCNRQGDWYGVVYSKERQDCNVSTPWPHTLPYTGPCRSGWAHRNWIAAEAG